MQKILQSRTTWTIVVLFIVNGIGAVHSFIPGALTPIVDGLLSILAIYFHINPSQQYAEVA